MGWLGVWGLCWCFDVLVGGLMPYSCFYALLWCLVL